MRIDNNRYNRNKKFANIISLVVFILALCLTLCMITWGGGAPQLK